MFLFCLVFYPLILSETSYLGFHEESITLLRVLAAIEKKNRLENGRKPVECRKETIRRQNIVKKETKKLAETRDYSDLVGTLRTWYLNVNLMFCQLSYLGNRLPRWFC